ncbi:adrenocortical dysplasia protein homolog isoform X5 [Chamaea fasciata]|uniref:adrenocortical dysplasia protein homolog isoform X5 n=1 Tax=Chamaea fasciata TaxID=190680 RepID=UPI00336A0607
MAAAAAPPGGANPGLAAGERLVCVDKNVASPKLYVLEPWIADLLVNYEQLEEREKFLAGQVVRVLSDSAAPGQPGARQDAVVQVSDGSCYIRVVITSEALQAEENAHLQLRLSSLNCRIIVLQKYTVCFQDEARLEDCEFYLTAQQFIVLPMQRQRMESSDGNQDPSVVKKIKELWQRNLAVRNALSSEPSVSQLIDAIGQNQLEILKENAEECLDLWKSKEKPVTVEDEVPITQWEAERKKELGEDIFMVPVSTLVIPPEEEAVVCDSSEAASAGYTGAASPTSSDSLDGSLDNPWNRMPSLSLTLSSSDEKSFQLDPPLNTQKDVAADSNTTDLLEVCSQGSPEGLPQGEPVQTSSPSLLRSYSRASLVEISTSEAAPAVVAARDTLCADQGPQGSRGSQATLPTLSPVFPVFPGSSLQSPSSRIPCREQACSGGTASSPDMLKPGLAHASTKGGETVGAKRKLMEEGEQAAASPGGQQHPPGTSKGRGRGTGKRSELVSPRGAKKNRKETLLQHRKELQEEEQASPARAGPSSKPEQCRALEPFVERPPQYQYEAPSPELCQQVQSIRISKAMLKWACWILTEEENS